MAYRIGIVCTVGVGPERGGRAENEDNYVVCEGDVVRFLDDGEERAEPGHGDGVLLAVCDGMGGHEHGQVASTTAARVLAKLFRPGVPRDPAKTLLKYIQQAHRQLHERARAVGPVRMGTTLTACWILNGKASWAHVGDSRLYLFRADTLIRLTPDHTRNEFARRDGLPPHEGGDHLCQTFIFGSRGLGDNASIRLDAGLDSGSDRLMEGDLLLLCSDGLTGTVDDDSVADLLRRHPDPQQAADALLAAAIARGSTDNITVLIVRVDATPHDGDPWADETDDTVMF